MWGASEVSTLTFTAACGGSGTADDGASWTVTSDGSESTYDATKGIHYGTGSAQVQYIHLSTSDITGTITQVTVNASAASGVSATVAVKVGTTDFTRNESTTASISTTATNYTFTGSASGEILVVITKPSKAAKAIYCKSVAVTYSSGGGSTPTLSSVAVSGIPTQTTYENGNAFDATGLTVTGTYSDSSNKTETTGITWTACKTQDGSYVALDNAAVALATNETSIYVKATVSGKTSPAFHVTGLTVTAALPKITITATSSGITTSYGDDTFTQSGVTFSYKQWMKSTDFIQAKASQSPSLKNTTAIPGIIKSIEVVTGSGKTARAVTVSGGTSAESLSSITAPSTAMSMTFDFGSNKYSYFALNTPGNACYFDKIIIRYEEVKSAVTISSPSHGTIAVKKKSDDSSVSSGTSIAAGTVLKVSIADVTGYRFSDLRAYKTEDQSKTVTISNGELTMPDYPITITADETALFAVDLTVAAQDENGDAQEGAQGNSATIDAGTVTVYKASSETAALVANKASDYDFVGWSASTGSITFTNSTATSTTATIGAAGTITATFRKKGCVKLGTPEVSVTNKTYNGAKLTWSGISNADKYKVYVYNSDKSEEIEHNDAVTDTEYTIGTALAGATTYTYVVSALSNTPASYCESNAAEATFTTNDYPSVTVTYSENGNTDNQVSKKIHTPFALPTSAAECSKPFVGWTTKDDFEDGDESEDSYYAKGANFTITSNAAITLYAVYADVVPGAATYTLTPAASLSAGTYVIAGYATNYKALTGSVSSGDPLNESTGFSIDEDSKIVTLPEDADEFTFTAVTGGFSIQNGEGKYLGYTSTSDNRKIAFGDAYSDLVWNATAHSKTNYPDDGLYLATSAYKLFTNGSGTSVVRGYKISADNYNPIYLFKKSVGAGTASNYTISCAASPTATPSPTALNDIAAAGVESGTITMTYTNVNTANVTVGLFNDEACTETFSGGWLTASLDGYKNITYTIAENTSYNDARSAYIKLTAPQTSGATDPAIVKIPVSQLKKAAVFASLQDLVAADVNANTPVTVTFSNVVIKKMYEYNDKVCGVVFNIQKAGEDIKIYFNSQETISDWVAGGKLSGTLTNCPWKIYSEAWQLAPASGWAWANLEYTAPASVSSVVVSGNPSKTTYDVGEAFDPAGLTVTVTYSDSHVETITSEDDEWAYVSWAKDPATFAAEHIGTGKSVTVTATYNAVDSDPTEISGLTVNKVAVTGVTLSQDAATLKAGKTLTLTATIAPENATYKTVNWSTSDGSIATVDNGAVKAVAEGSATITATSTDDNTKYATCAITVTAGTNFAAGDWTLVKDVAELTAGSYVIIAAAEFDYAMLSYSSGNNCSSKAAKKSGDLLTYDADFGIFEIKAGNVENTIALFDDKNENYLYAASSSNNYLKAEETLTNNSSWSASVTSAGVASLTAQGTNTHNILKYNSASDQKKFSAYGSSNQMADIALYKYFAPVPKVTYRKNTEDEVTNLPGVQKTVWETDAYKATIAAGPSRSGYAFNGWNSAEDGNGDAYTVGVKYSFATDITLYAQWEEIPTYSVTYNTSGSTGTTPVDANAYAEGDEVTLASASGLSNPGHFFNGWVATYVDGNSDTQTLDIEDGKFTMPAFNVTVTATWARISNQKWVLVENMDDLKTDGTKYIIAGAEHNVGMGALNGSIYNSVGVTKDGKTLKGPEMTELTFEAGSEGKLAIKHGSKYVYSTSAKSIGERDETFEWTISISEGVATINAGSAGTLQYNSGNPRFTTYTSTQQPVAIYIKSESVVVSGNQNISGITAGSDVTVENGGVLTVNEDKSIGDLTVENGGKVVLSSNKLTVVGVFSIESTMAGGSSGQLTGATNTNFAASGEAYIDITLGAGATADQWHAFTVPFPVDAINGVFDLDGNKLNNEEHYAIMEYDGSVRAQGKYGWKKIRTTLVPGTFYLMTVDGLRTTFRFKKKASEAIVAANSKQIYEYAKASEEVEDKHAGWNGIGNPNLFYGKIDVEVQVLDPNNYVYVKKDPNSTNFVVGTPFFYQASADGWISMLTADAGSKYAPRREEAKSIEKIKVSFGNEEYTDYLDIWASEEALNKYQIGKDLVKMTMTNAPKVAQIFGNAYNSKLCMVYAPMSNDKAEYALSLYAPANGEYTIAAQQIEDAEVYLTKDGSVIWNISESAYTAEFTKGSTESYGLLMIKKTPQVTTGIDGVESSKAAQKLIIDQNVFILRGEKMYDVTGKEVK